MKGISLQLNWIVGQPKHQSFWPARIAKSRSHICAGAAEAAIASLYRAATRRLPHPAITTSGHS